MRRKGVVIGAASLAVVLAATAAIGISVQWLRPSGRLVAALVIPGQRPLPSLPAARIGHDFPEGVGGARPPMGWNGFNHYYIHVTGAIVEAEARALVDSGMAALGYQYVNIDGGWDLKTRDSSGALRPDPRKFPDGIAPVAAYVHSLGLKFGMYTSAGFLNCAATSAGSYGHFQQDARLFASWGVDYLKFDWCNIPYEYYPHMTHVQVGVMLARQMREALTATGREILYDVNDYIAADHTWTWAPGISDLWRTTPDQHDDYQSLLWNFEHNVGLYRRAGPDGWNDPDMLEVGNWGMSATEYRSQFTLWSEMAAPLIAGNNLVTMTPAIRDILTNPYVIAVDQDPLGKQGYVVSQIGGHWVMTKLLADGDRAVVFFNQTNSPVRISTTAAAVGLERAPVYNWLNLWTGEVDGVTASISAVVPAHAVVMYRVEGLFPPSTPNGQRAV